MLEKDPKKRVSINEIMVHPWIADMFNNKEKKRFLKKIEDLSDIEYDTFDDQIKVDSIVKSPGKIRVIK